MFRNVLIVYSPFFRTHSLPPPKLFYVLPLLRFAFFHHVFFPDFDIVLLHLHEFFCIYAVRAPARNLFVFLFYPTFSLFFRWLTHLAIEFREDDIKERRLSISVIQIPYWRFDITKHAIPDDSSWNVGEKWQIYFRPPTFLITLLATNPATQIAILVAIFRFKPIFLSLTRTSSWYHYYRMIILCS